MRGLSWNNEDEAKLNHAVEANEEAEQTLDEVRERVKASKTVERTLREIRERNHFREMFVDALK